LCFISLIQFTEFKISGTNFASIAAKLPEQGSEEYLLRQRYKRGKGGKAKYMATTLLLNKFQRLIFKKANWKNEVDRIVFGQKVGLITKLFGCWHDNISRPFTQGKSAYRSCLNCGAMKQFNTETLETHGHYYFPPIIKEERS